MEVQEIKRLVGRRAAATLVTSGMRVGLGTGSTAVEAVRMIGELVRAGTLTDMLFVPTSLQAEAECVALGLSWCSLNDPVLGGELDLSIDGADEVDPRGRLIKGMGGAMLREKIVASVSRRYAIVVDDSKLVGRLGEKSRIPVEVAPEARAVVERRLGEMGFDTRLRMAVEKDGPVITESGNLILDISSQAAFVPERLEQQLNGIPGVMENGVFCIRATDLFVGLASGEVEHRRFDGA